MSLLQTDEKILETSLEGNEDFDPKEWRAVRIYKQQLDKGDHFFAYIIRKYGPDDYGESSHEEAWIGRKIVYVGKKDWDTNPKSPTFGKRVYREPEEVTEEEYNYNTGQYEKKKYAINATKRYKFLHKADDKETQKLYKSLIGDLPNGSRTQLIFIYGDRIVDIENQKDFFDRPVQDLKDLERKKASLFDDESERIKKGQQSETTN